MSFELRAMNPEFFIVQDRETRIESLVILSEVRRQPNAAEGPLVIRVRHMPVKIFRHRPNM